MARQRSQHIDGDPLWYKDAVIYQLHVKAFFDGSGDGYGDFRGLSEKLDYIEQLGVDAIWLLPFYPSPLRDDGYDISDYFNVHPDYGTMRDFRAFVREAHRRGLRVITELVINHTSDQHPWFQAARQAPAGTRKRDFYVWSDTDQKYDGTRIIFTDTESSNWAWDPVAQAYYWHRFFSHQPDLNYDNSRVLREVTRVMRFWFDAGVDGVRLDAIPYLCEREGTNNENLPETHAVIKQMRAELDARYQGRMFLGEANQWPEDVRPYFGDGDECHMAFHFPLMPRMFMALAQEDRHPIVDIMEQTPEIPESCQWAIFLRNHDELTLEMVTDRERDYMYEVYARDERMRVNVGIRRRLAPLVDNDLDRVKLLKNLLLSMPGSPVIYYGDEIGMGDNVFLGDRNGVRTPMQWAPDRNGGFSTADPARLYLPPLMDPVYGYEAVNVEAQARYPFSLLNWTRRLIAVRRAHRAFGRGGLRFLHPGNRKVLAYLREYGDTTIILCVSNLSRAAQPVELDLAEFRGRVPVDMVGRSVFPPIGELPYLLTLPGYGFFWFLLTTETEAPPWHVEMLPPEQLSTLVLFTGWDTFFPERIARSDPGRKAMAEKLRDRVEREVWPRHVAEQRWFAGKGEPIRRVALTDHGQLASGRDSFLIAIVDVEQKEAEQRYFMPLSLVWGDGQDDQVRALLHRSFARVRYGPRTGVLVDAFADERFARGMVSAIGRGTEIEGDGGTLRFVPSTAFAELVGDDVGALEVRTLGVEQSNSSVVLGDRVVLKGYRRLEDGIDPELEIGRFLTDVSPFDHIAPVAGHVEQTRPDGTVVQLAVLQGFVRNQGDAWTHTLDHLERYLEGMRLDLGESQRQELEAQDASYMALVHQLGLRTGELHVALSRSSGDPAFEPEPVRLRELRSWVSRIRGELRRSLSQLRRARKRMDDEARADAERLLGLEVALKGRLDGLANTGFETWKVRHHGDFHLGQVLVVENDVVIIDFEGEPARSLEERRAKHSPLRDVAGLLRSLNYAALSALARITTESPTLFDELAPSVRAWEERASAAFRAGYAEGAAESPLYPDGLDAVRGLLELFELEKALYELRYELANRPGWVRIPLRGLLAILGRGEP